jgi:N utilization substance protein A
VNELVLALKELAKERNMSEAVLIDALRQALLTAYQKNHGDKNARVDIDPETGDVHVYALREVAENPEDERTQISQKEAAQIRPDVEVGDYLEEEVTPKDFGRVAAQSARQNLLGRIRDAERGQIYQEFRSREKDIVTGLVTRFEGNQVMIDLGRVEAVLGPNEQVAGETYRVGDRLKTYIVEVRTTRKGPEVVVSRSHPGLVRRLLELEVPELQSGEVELRELTREAGQRTKVAVYSENPRIDPVGACVGGKGARIQAIVNELRGEKIDVIRWDPDPATFIAQSLSPAKVIHVVLVADEHVANVIVPDYQLSLAIGREGQNARLAAKLTGWRIDIKSETQAAQARREGLAW